MNHIYLYAIVGVILFTLGLYALISCRHLLRKVLAVNIMGSGVFLILVALAAGETPDPVPHAMVITGIVVAVSASALALALVLRVQAETGKAELPEESQE